MSKIYGIDLGTTNSCIAVLKDGMPHVIPVDGSGIVPSVVSFDGKKILVGRKAKNRAAAFPEQSVRSVKRLMGSPERLTLGRKSYDPEDISAMILRYLCDEAKKLEGHEVERAVITVPAYFSDAQRRATMEAGARAGLRVERIINEPTAAALFYDHVGQSGTQRADQKEACVLVYDLGGGTFDVSVLRMGDIIEVLASTGDSHLGGDDFDRRIVGKIAGRVKQQDGLDLMEGNVPGMARLSAVAEEAKIALSEKASVMVQEAQISAPDGKSCSVSIEFSREDFEYMTEDLVARTMESVEKAMTEARLTPDRIDKVLLVGGMTRMPLIASKLEALFGAANLPVIDPDLSVAKGAAIQGGIISGENCALILVDVTPHTLSLASLSHTEGLFLECTPIIPRNTQIPVTRAKTFATLTRNQRAAQLDVYQGESVEPDENTLIGATTLNLAPAEECCPITVEYSYDANGVVHLVAEQKGYSRRTELRIDSRNPKLFEVQDLEELDDMEEDDWESGSGKGGATERSAPMNFVIQRARAMIEKAESGAKRVALSDLLKKYEKSLMDDDDAADDIEDALLSAMEDM